VNPKLNYLKEYESKNNSNPRDKINLNLNTKSKTAKENKQQEDENLAYSLNKKNFKDKADAESNRFSKPNNPHPKTPNDFYEKFQLIKEMRDKVRAPVDDMGVECTIESNTDRRTYKFQTLVSLILSAQTNDKITFTVMKRLLDYGLSVDSIAEISEADLVKLIYEVNFHNNKARSLINVNKFSKVIK